MNDLRMGQDRAQPPRPFGSSVTEIRADRPQLSVARMPAEAEADLARILSLLWRRKWIVAATMLATLALALAFLMTVTPRYTATSVVVLDTREEQVVDLESVVSGLQADSAVVNTEVEVIKSRRLINRVVERLSLDTDPEFVPRLRPDPAWKGWMHATLGRFVDLAGMARDAAPLSEANRAFRDRQTAIDTLLRRLGVVNVRQSYVFSISVESADAAKAAEIANTIADLYILEQLDAKFEATKKATDWLSERVAELRLNLEAAESAVEDYNAGATLVSEEALAANNRRVKELRDRLQMLREDRARLSSQIDAVGTLRKKDDFAAIADLTGIPRLEGLSESLQGGSPVPEAQLLASFDSLLGQYVTRSNQQILRLDSQIGALTESVAMLESEIGQQSNDMVQLRQLMREAESNRLLYEHFLGRMKETAVQQGIQQADSRVLSPAIAPLQPSYPKSMQIAILAILAGGVAGIGLSLLLDRIDNSFRTADELERHTGLSVLGSIPEAPMRRRRALLEYTSKKPNSQLAESVRNLRTSVLMTSIDRPPQVMMTTSSIPAEGKTIISLLLSQNSAALGKRVLVVECDLRRRTFKNAFNLDGRHGLLSVLSGAAAFEDVVHTTPEGVDVIVGQESATNAADVFSSERFSQFVMAMREAYDFIFFDTPPVLTVPDARVIARQADAVIYAVRWNKTPRALVTAGLQQFSSLGIRVTGLALTQVNPSKAAQYGGYGSYYGTYYRASKKYYHG